MATETIDLTEAMHHIAVAKSFSSQAEVHAGLLELQQALDEGRARHIGNFSVAGAEVDSESINQYLGPFPKGDLVATLIAGERTRILQASAWGAAIINSRVAFSRLGSGSIITNSRLNGVDIGTRNEEVATSIIHITDADIDRRL